MQGSYVRKDDGHSGRGRGRRSAAGLDQRGHASKWSPGVSSYPRIPFYSPLSSRGYPSPTLSSLGQRGCCNRTAHITPPHLVIARAESPWRSTVRREAKRQTRSRPSRHDGLPRQSLAFLPRNDKVCCPRLVHFITSTPCHREG